MSKIYFVVYFIIAFIYTTKAQVLLITNHDTGEPIEMVSIMSKQPHAVALTNIKGKADISSFKTSEKIEIRSLGYKTEVTNYNQLEKIEFKIALKPAYFNIDEVVISANKWEQIQKDIPEKILSIKKDEMILQNPQTAADLLSISGKVFIQKSQQGGGSPMIRGFATNRLLYTIDGVRMNTAIYRSGNIQNVISLDPLSIERTEVLFGPGSVIYGSDAIGGVMSFTSLTPQFSHEDKALISGSAISRYSSANQEATYHFNINLGWKKWALITSISSSNYGDLKMGSNGPDEYLCPYYVVRQDSTDVIVSNTDPQVQKPSGYSQINIMQKIRWKPNNNWDINYGFHYSETSDYDRYDRHIRYKNGLPRYGEWYYGPQKWMMNNINISNSKQLPIFDELTLRIAQQYFEESRISRDINKPDRERRLEKVNAYSTNLDFHKQIGLKNNLYYGFEFVYNDVTSTGTNENINTGESLKGPSRYPNSEWYSYAVYISNKYDISEKVNLQAGLRYSQFVLNSVFDTEFYPLPFDKANLNDGAITGSLGGVYKPAENWIISSNISTAYRSPNVDDVGKIFDSEPGSVVVPNTDLKAEYAYNIDLSLAHIIQNTVKLDITAYYTYLNNALVRRDYELNNMDSIMYGGELSKVQAIQNAAFAQVYGIQAGIEIKLPQNFSFSSDINYQKGIEELDDGTASPTRHAPPLYGNLSLQYSKNKLLFKFYAIYSGEKSFDNMPIEEIGKDYMYAKDNNGKPYSPAWYTINFKAMYQFTENFTISAGVENITDQRYRPYSSGIVAPGRNFIISLKAGF
jgi:hemoglobin/transferrin/lactoferrin receptor protein